MRCHFRSSLSACSCCLRIRSASARDVTPTSTVEIDPPVTVTASDTVTKPPPAAVNVHAPSGNPRTMKCPAPSARALFRTLPQTRLT